MVKRRGHKTRALADARSSASSQLADLLGQEEPRAVVPTLVGTPLHVGLEHYGCKDYFVGQEAMDSRGILKLTRPIKHGVITDFKAYEEVRESLNLYMN